VTDERITVRLPADEMRRVEAHASALRLSKADVVRFALTSHFSRESSAAKTAEIADRLRDELARVSDQNRRTATLLLLVMKAPQEAQQTLAEIYKD
jgi:hypothetical protein